jgi:ADP-ribose pyrophosphatase YjhB (NUDIX family)
MAHIEERMVKESAGIILCRKSPIKNYYEALLVHKRVSYSFSEFIHGRYANFNSALKLFEKMSREELIIIRSLDFELMWYHIWISKKFNNNSYFDNRKGKFKKIFLSRDNGKKLIEHIQKIRPSHGDHIWELPKGRKKEKSESLLSCAIRELTEETKILDQEYKIFPYITQKKTFIDENVNYKYHYFAALAHHRLAGGLRDDALKSPYIKDEEGEISEARWMSITDIRHYEGESGRISSLVQPIFNKFKNMAVK